MSHTGMHEVLQKSMLTDKERVALGVALRKLSVLTKQEVLDTLLECNPELTLKEAMALRTKLLGESTKS